MSQTQTIHIEELLAHADWARDLARGLVRDSSAADDLVQEAWVATLRHPPASRRNLRGWIAKLLQNSARRRQALETARGDHEHLSAAPASPPTPEELASQVDSHRLLSEAVLSLAEPYRSTVTLRYLRGWNSAEIARLQGVPAGTVRWRLKQALDQLRLRLDEEVGGHRRTWCLALGVLASPTASKAPTAAVLSGLLQGFVLMKVSGKIACVLAALVVAGVALVAIDPWSAGPEAEESPGATADGSLPPVEDPAPPGSTEAPAAPVEDRVALTAPATPTTGSLRVVCRWGEDGSVASGIVLLVTPRGVKDGKLLSRRVTSDHDGVALLHRLPRGRVFGQAVRGGRLETEILAGSTVEVELEIPSGVHVRGRVLDESGSPVTTAQVWLSTEPRIYLEGQYVASVDSAGRFFLRSARPGCFLCASAPGLRTAVVQPVQGDIGSTVEVELVLRGAGVSLVGTVVDPNGAAVPGARVSIGWRDGSLAWDPRWPGEFRPPLALVSDERGVFRAHGLQPVAGYPVWVRAVGYCAWHEVVQTEEAGEKSVRVRLEPGAVIAGRATDGEGHPVPRASVAHRSTGLHFARGDFYDFRGPSWAHSSAFTDQEGRYRIEGVAPDTIRLIARHEERECRGEAPAVAGETITWDPVLVEVAIRGRVVDERGEALSGFAVQARPPRGKGKGGSATTDADGRFSCEALSRVPYVLSFYAPAGRVRIAPAAKRWGVEPGGDELLVRVLDSAIPSSTITGTLLDRDGEVPQEARVTCSAEGGHSSSSTEVDPDAGTFRIGPLCAGTYRLQGCVSRRRHSAWSELVVLAPGEDRDIGEMRMPVPGSIALTATGPDGMPLEGAHASLNDSLGWGEFSLYPGRIEQGQVHLRGVGPGDYRLRVYGSKIPEVHRSVRVVAGEEAKVEVQVPTGIECKLVLLPCSEPVPIDQTFVWRRDGDFHSRYTNLWEVSHQRISYSLFLLPGAYEVTITSETGKVEVNHFVVTADDPPGREIKLWLP